MKKFDVEITETLQRTVSVEAVSQEEAEKIVTEAWNNEDYVLDSTDFVSVDFKTVGEQELSENRKMEILLVQPGMYPQKVTIGTELKDFQDGNYSAGLCKPSAQSASAGFAYWLFLRRRVTARRIFAEQKCKEVPSWNGVRLCTMGHRQGY